MLSSAQLLVLKADINSPANAAALAGFIASRDGPQIAAFYNQPVPGSPEFLVWRTEVPVQDIFDAITWANFTPNDAVTDAVLVDALVCARQQTRLLVLQTKQMNLQNMLVGRSTVDASKANYRAGIRDCLVNLPAGVNGASVQAAGASGVTAMLACTRKATVAEKLLANGSAMTGTVSAFLMGFEGALNGQNVLDALDAQ